jgi:phospholipid-binding lipoprotein MlaA
MRSVSSLAAALVLVCGLTTAAAAESWNDHDPWIGFNRAIFSFNDKLDVYVLEPVARGWDFVAPKRLQTSLSNFFDNIRYPRVALNNLLQGKPRQSASDVGRFLVNTTVGVAGFFDPASVWGLTRHNEDFGQTLGVWRLPPGPYLVLPFFGPSSPRDTVGLAVDSVSTVYWVYAPLAATAPMTTVDTVNGRALVLDQVHDIKEASVDYYSAVRNGYLQRREALINDREGMSEQQRNDLYTIEDDKE